MKRFAGLLVLILSSAVLLFAQGGTAAEMTGQTCNSKCVVQSAGHASCDQACSERNGVTVFIDEQGNVSSIANPNTAGSQPEKSKARITKEDRDLQNEEYEYFDRLVRYAGGGG